MSAEIRSDFRLDLKKISTYQKKSLLTTTKKWLSSRLTSAYLMHARTTRKIPWPAKHYWLDLSFPKPNSATCCLLCTEFLFPLPLKMIWKPRNFLRDSVKQALCLDHVVTMPSCSQLLCLLCSSLRKWKTWQMQSSYFSLLFSSVMLTGCPEGTLWKWCNVICETRASSAATMRLLSQLGLQITSHPVFIKVGASKLYYHPDYNTRIFFFFFWFIVL